ncbi:amylo-alpha-1,6-glucosidase [Deinococcus deserti]|uniref:Putative glycogen debranching enzyme n=1 Tax=Deinococcus deserti (strain DSM 17065 / CIP 109153 / LMG 22923 / VCD115) TaxID=546414 RepID=C1D0V8_DEIDV|nr:amylo-alpha-1,6-glucosidase [Deinococcus deserti]ACO45482.2 putative glycogen debranching enzyme [Deinococcus deserti VCD115]
MTRLSASLPAVTQFFGPGQARCPDLEVLLTDGRGGFSLGSLAGVPTRCYSALNLSQRPPVQRYAHVVSPLEILSTSCGEATLHALELAPNVFEGQVQALLAGATLRDLLPEREQLWRGARVRRRSCMPQGADSVVYLYDVQADEPVTLTLGGYFVDRDMHSVHASAPALSLSCSGHEAVIEGQRQTRVRLHAPGAGIEVLTPAPFPQRIYYRHDAARGEAESELTLGAELWRVRLPEGGGQVALVFSSGPAPGVPDPWAAYMAEATRRRTLAEQAWAATGVRDDLVATLAVAADAYLAQRSAPAGVTVIAGYPWFADWGRDAMIALTGLTLVTGRYAEARELLGTFLATLRRGLIPNNFHENGSGAGYNTVDGALWLVVALERYVQASGDLDFARQSLPQVRELLSWHVRGTDHGICMDPIDGLLLAGKPGVQLTWMDVKIEGWVVTPRHGKPVEIQALWLAALGAESRLSERLGEMPEFAAQFQQAQKNFGAFWTGTAFADTVSADGVPDLSTRPNVALALALPDTPATPAQLQAAAGLVRRELLTPLGLHTLSPLDARYRGNYGGTQVQRDAAYHQGTVWPWPLASYVDLLLSGGNITGARDALRGLQGHVWEAGLGHVSEVFNGLRLTPGGCPFQAWSVAELLRAHVKVARAERQPAG